MIQIAILEDDEDAARTLQYVINTYASKNNVVFGIKCFSNAEAFLADTRTAYDIAFMDIELSGMSGMDAAFRLREIDKNVIIIFVTNMAQYAVRGYEVNALYYIIKPVTYQNVAYKLKKALTLLSANTDKGIVLRQNSGLIRIAIRNLIYIEVTGHKLLYHTDTQTHSIYSSISDAEKELKDYGFFRCNSCYLVNARYIASVSGLTVTLHDGTELQISHPRKKQFILDLGNWLGEGNI